MKIIIEKRQRVPMGYIIVSDVARAQFATTLIFLVVGFNLISTCVTLIADI